MENLAVVKNTDISSLSECFHKMKEAHLQNINPSYEVRLNRLERLEKAIENFADKIQVAINDDYGHRSAAETNAFDITVPIGDVRMNKKNLKKWMKYKKYPIPLHLEPASGKVIPQPKGVIGVISPWNFPIYLATAPLAAALAAGNRVMIKPSELTPKTSLVLKEMIESEFDEQEVSVHLGGADVASEFSSLPFNHILFTGSTNVGKMVAQAAAKNLTPVTLELGGKSPTIVGKGADLERAAERIAYAKTANAGQICVAPDYVFVPKESLTEFITLVEKNLKHFYPQGFTSDDYTSILTSRHKERLESMVQEVKESGADVREVFTGSAIGNKLSPTLLVNPGLSSKVMQEEIFGPLLPIMTYDKVEDAINFINSRPSPLALYIFSDDKSEQNQWLTQTISGGACVNEAVFHVVADTMPFGGVGESGMGAYHGQAGFETFSHMKSVLFQPKLNGAFLFNPPFVGWKKGVLSLLRKII